MAFNPRRGSLPGEKKGKSLVKQKLMMVTPPPSQVMDLLPIRCLLNT